MAPNRRGRGGERGERGERGSVLMLMPAAVLVLLVLGGIAVDSAVVLLAQRELASATAAAANDAAGAALDDGAFYRRGDIDLDPATAQRVAVESVAARAPAGLQLLGPPEVVVDGRQVCVSLRATVRRIFARSIPGHGGDAVVTARSTATAARDGDGDGEAARADPRLC